MGAISTLSSFRISGLILSRPAALPGLRLNNSFKIPLSEISMSGIIPGNNNNPRPCNWFDHLVSLMKPRGGKGYDL